MQVFFCEKFIFAVKNNAFSRKICVLLAFFSRITRMEAYTLYILKFGLGYKIWRVAPCRV